MPVLNFSDKIYKVFCISLSIHLYNRFKHSYITQYDSCETIETIDLSDECLNTAFFVQFIKCFLTPMLLPWLGNNRFNRSEFQSWHRLEIYHGKETYLLYGTLKWKRYLFKWSAWLCLNLNGIHLKKKKIYYRNISATLLYQYYLFCFYRSLTTICDVIMHYRWQQKLKM